MSEITLPLTPEQEQEYRVALARQEQMRSYQAALARHQVYLAIKPLIESEEFISVHQQIAEFRESGPKDDAFFGIGIDTVFAGMTNLGIQVANWTAPVDPSAPVEPIAPLTPPNIPPAPEGNTDGE